jgi:glycosyltransferase involved in cell wall biosynthesis
MKQSYKDFDILVIDNGSTDDTSDVLKIYPVKVIKDPTKKLSYLFNLAWKSTSGNYIAFLADDVEVHPDWSKNAIETFTMYDGIGAVGGPIISTQKQEMHRLYEEATQSKLLSFIAKIYERVVMEGRLFDP